jgi:lipid-A-disaccharide synthase-like uncharacterized protein
METFLVALAVWVGCGLIGAGFMNADWKAEFPRDPERERQKTLRVFMAFGVLGGIVFLVISLMITGFGFDGWSLNSRPKEKS